MSFFLTVVIENCEILKHSDTFYKTYRALKILFSSPLNKSNNLRVILHTSTNVMIELDPLLNIPSDIEEFKEIFEYLLKRMKLKASNDKVLARVVKSKIDDHLTPNTFRIGVCPEGKVLNDIDLKGSYTVFLNLGDKEGCEVEYKVRLSNYEVGIDAVCCRLVSLFEGVLEIY